jgi:pyridoxine/pyridoxamine 5'-phosphate oxidase
MIEHIPGRGASVAAWDQAHAEAMNALRQSEAFVLATVDTEGHVRFQAVSHNVDTAGMVEILLAVGETSVDSAVELADAMGAA